MRCPTVLPGWTAHLHGNSVPSYSILVISVLPLLLSSQHRTIPHPLVKAKKLPLVLSCFLVSSQFSHFLHKVPYKLLDTQTVPFLSFHSLYRETFTFSEIDLHLQSPAGAFWSLSGQVPPLYHLTETPPPLPCSFSLTFLLGHL